MQLESATVISVFALVLSAFALGWNIYRDVVLRARVRVRVAVVQILSGDSVARKVDERINISVANLGPGPVQIVGIKGKMRNRLFGRVQHFVILQDHSNPMSATLPRRLDVGDTLDLYLPHERRSFLSSGATHIGIRDSFGRSHFAPRREFRKAIEQHRMDFPPDSGSSNDPPA